jgi:hypothetical protein
MIHVIPAKAGIYSDSFDEIPAFAGMTALIDVSCCLIRGNDSVD